MCQQHIIIDIISSIASITFHQPHYGQVDRSVLACAHAVDIAKTAKEAFEQEHRRLQDASRELARYVDRKVI